MKQLFYTSVGIVAILLTACSGDPAKKTNKIPEQSSVQGTEAISDTDMDFITHAGHGNAAEVSEGKLAAGKGMGASVRSIGKMMEKDHSAALEELVALGQKLGVTVPTLPNEKQTASEHELAQLSGAEFDRQYIKAQVDEHEKTVKLFEDEIKNGTNPDLKAYASKYLPTIQHHLDMAKHLKETVK